MRVSKMTVYRLVHNGELPAVRVGRSFRVHAKAVHDLLETSYFDAGCDQAGRRVVGFSRTPGPGKVSGSSQVARKHVLNI